MESQPWEARERTREEKRAQDGTSMTVGRRTHQGHREVAGGTEGGIRKALGGCGLQA